MFYVQSCFTKLCDGKKNHPLIKTTGFTVETRVCYTIGVAVVDCKE